MVDKTEQICDLIQAINEEYETVFEEYSQKVVEKMHYWLEENNIEESLRHALLCYAIEIANVLSLELHMTVALYDPLDYNSSTSRITEEVDE